MAKEVNSQPSPPHSPTSRPALGEPMNPESAMPSTWILNIPTVPWRTLIRGRMVNIEGVSNEIREDEALAKVRNVTGKEPPSPNQRTVKRPMPSWEK